MMVFVLKGCRLSMPKLKIEVREDNVIKFLPTGESIKDKEIYSRYPYRCSYCLKIIQGKDVTRDHVISRKKIISQLFNIVPSCSECNNKKGNMSLLEFLGLI